MKGFLVLLVIVGIAVLPYVLRRILRTGWDKAEDAIRNSRIDRERMEGKTNKVESLADRYGQVVPSDSQASNKSNTTETIDSANAGEKYCFFCGKKIPINAEFCSYCGKKQ